jgi:hypothetical protein
MVILVSEDSNRYAHIRIQKLFVIGNQLLFISQTKKLGKGWVAPVVFVWFWLFFCCLRRRGRRYKRVLLQFFPKHRFLFFHYHKMNLLYSFIISKILATVSLKVVSRKRRRKCTLIKRKQLEHRIRRNLTIQLGGCLCFCFVFCNELIKPQSTPPPPHPTWK